MKKTTKKNEEVQDQEFVKVTFTEDKFIDGKIFAQAGEEIEIPIESRDRWIKRGGTIVGEEVSEVSSDVTTAEVMPEPQEDLIGDHSNDPELDENGELAHDEEYHEEEVEGVKKKTKKKKKSNK